MNQTNVISVNPGVKTLGELNIGNSTIVRISRRLTRPGRVSASPFKAIVRFVFGVSRDRSGTFSTKMAMLRMSAAAITILAALWQSGGLEAAPTAPVLAMLAFIVSLALGLFTRLVATSAMAICGYMFYLSIMGGMPDAMSAVSLVVSLMFALLGPGRYSADQLIVKGFTAIYRRSRARAARREKKAEFDYKAYHRVDRRVS